MTFIVSAAAMAVIVIVVVVVVIVVKRSKIDRRLRRKCLRNSSRATSAPRLYDVMDLSIVNRRRRRTRGTHAPKIAYATRPPGFERFYSVPSLAGRAKRLSPEIRYYYYYYRSLLLIIGLRFVSAVCMCTAREHCIEIRIETRNTLVHFAVHRKAGHSLSCR